MYGEQGFTFTYERGVLRPERRLDLPEGARGIARTRETQTPDEQRRMLAINTLWRIGESGAFNSGGHKLTRDQMHERA